MSRQPGWYPRLKRSNHGEAPASPSLGGSKMKILTIIAIILCTAGIVYAAKANLPVDGLGIRAQGFAPDGKKSVSLTVVKQTVDMRDDIAYEVYAPTACKFRGMTSATVRGTLSTLPANARLIRNVNATTPFVNFTGCTNGELLRQ